MALCYAEKPSQGDLSYRRLVQKSVRAQETSEVPVGEGSAHSGFIPEAGGRCRDLCNCLVPKRISAARTAHSLRIVRRKWASTALADALRWLWHDNPRSLDVTSSLSQSVDALTCEY